LLVLGSVTVAPELAKRSNRKDQPMTICFLSCRSLLVASVLALASEALAEMPAVRTAQLRYTCEIAEVPEGAKAADLWIPMPSDNQRQTVRLLNESELGEGRITTDKKFGNRIYYRRFESPLAGGGEKPTARGAPIKVELLYDVEVHEATVAAAKDLISTTEGVPGPELAPYLSDSKMIPIKGRVSQLARGIKLADGEPLRAGRKIYDYLIDTMVYDYKAPGAGTGNAVWACDSKTGDCTDFHSVFIGVCRSRGILPELPLNSTGKVDRTIGDIASAAGGPRLAFRGVFLIEKIAGAASASSWVR